MLIQTHQLDNQQLEALDILSVDCKSTDGDVVAIYRHILGTNRGRPSNILCYQQTSSCHPRDKVVGFLGAFFFYEDACEIAIMVAPKFRRQGIALQMLKAILPLIRGEGITRLVFSSPHGLNDHWLSALGLQFQGSEFQMQYSGIKPIEIQNSSITVRIATDIDIPTLCAIDNACFPKHRVDMPERIHTLLSNPDHCLFIISQNGKTVGKAHLNWQPNGVRLSDIAILPNTQGQGLGTALLAHCINHALSKNKPDIVLDVETSNKQALGLYTRLGFTIKNAHDYWSIDEFGLTAFLHHL